MALTVCAGCQRHVRDGEECPFCGKRPKTTAHIWKAAVLTAMMPLGLAACYGVPQTPGAADFGATPSDPTKGEPVELDSAIPDPSGHDPGEPEPEPDKPEPEPNKPEPEPEAQDSAPSEAEGGENTDPDGTQTPIVPDTRPARKYGAPPRPDNPGIEKPPAPTPPPRKHKTKYGAPPRPAKPKPAPKKP
ncbi:MAG: hypothetical protein ACRBN8_07170 [Nannocystales bacterium]